jgi:hypothetical protein
LDSFTTPTPNSNGTPYARRFITSPGLAASDELLAISTECGSGYNNGNSRMTARVNGSPTKDWRSGKRSVIV